MLGWRLTVSFVLVPAFIGICYADAVLGPRALVLLVLCVLLAIRGSWEMTQLLTTRSFHPSFALTAILSVVVVVGGWVVHLVPDNALTPSTLESLGAIALSTAVATLALMLVSAARYREPGRSMETLGAELLIVVYIGLLLAVTAQLRWVAGAEAGYLALGSLVIAAKCGDIGAYTLGRLFGRRKMVPLLSPGKTWMGGLGALLGSALAGVCWFRFATPAFNPLWTPCAWWWAFLFGAIIGVTGLVGDLCESLIKRDVGRKDSAALLPGFGGLLDLLDSILYAGPVAYLLWAALPLATWRV